jgi:hypothetical protein
MTAVHPRRLSLQIKSEGNKCLHNNTDRYPHEGRGKNSLDECYAEAAFVTPNNLTASIEICVWYAQGKSRWYQGSVPRLNCRGRGRQVADLAAH